MAGQRAACWAVVTKNGRFGYVANAGTGNISGFMIGSDGSATLLNGDGITATTGANPTRYGLVERQPISVCARCRSQHDSRIPDRIGWFPVASAVDHRHTGRSGWPGGVLESERYADGRLAELPVVSPFRGIGIIDKGL